jgi:DNA repair protein RecO (recombination protein O)
MSAAAAPGRSPSHRASAPSRSASAPPRNAPARSSGSWSAYVLHQYDWSESSLIIDAFTREAGRVALVAKGAKRPYSQLRGVLLPFQRLVLTPSKPTGGTKAPSSATENSSDEILNLRQAEWAAQHPMPQGGALLAGFYLNELLMKLLARGDPHAGLFDLYGHAIALLAALPAGHEGPVLRAFEWCLLRDIGLLPDLTHDSMSGSAVDPQGLYRLSGEHGLARRTRAADEPVLAGEALLQVGEAMGRDTPGSDFAALLQACERHERTFKPALRELLHYHLGASRLRTRELVRELQRLAPAAGLAGPQPTKLHTTLPATLPTTLPTSLPANPSGIDPDTP